MPKTVADVLAMAAKVQMVDLRFTDLPGVWQHFTIPAHNLYEETFENGVPFDGSSIRGFKEIHESDMILVLDPSTAFVDPIYQVPTLAIIGDVYDPITREPYTRDPRFIARRAETYLKQTGIGDTVFFGPEPEFFIFGDVRYGSNTNEAFYHLDSSEGWWNSGKELGPNYRRADRAEARLLPDPTHRHAAGRALEDRAGHRGRGHPGRDPSPRGCVRRPGRNRHAVRHADPHGRQRDDLQVHGQERRAAERPDRHLHAQAAVRRQRLGHALPPEHLARRQEHLLRRRRATRSFPTRPSTTSAACSSTRRRCSRSLRRRRTRTAGWCPASRRP